MIQPSSHIRQQASRDGDSVGAGSGDCLPEDRRGNSSLFADDCSSHVRIDGAIPSLVDEIARRGEGLFGKMAFAACNLTREPRHCSRGLPGMLVAAIDTGRVRGIGVSGSFAAEAGEVLLIDLMQPLTVQCEAGGSMFAILPQWLLDPAAFGGGWHGAVFPANSASASLVSAAISLALDGHFHEDGGLSTALTGLIAAGLPQAERVASSRPLTDPVSDLRRFVEANLADPELTSTRLAREFGMARASLYRHFESLGGIAAFIRSIRLARARELIERSGGQGLRLGTLAAEVGFASPTVFARAFREAYGMTPRDCLRQVRSGQSNAALRAGAGG